MSNFSSIYYRYFMDLCMSLTNILNYSGLGSRSRSEPGVFGSLEPEPLEEKKRGAGAAWKKNQEPEPLEKKVRNRSRKKICRLPSPEIISSYQIKTYRFSPTPRSQLTANSSTRTLIFYVNSYFLQGMSWSCSSHRRIHILYLFSKVLKQPSKTRA